MLLETGMPIAEVARDLGVHDGTLGNRVGTWRRDHPEPDEPLTPVEHARVKEPEGENRRLRMENEFLTGRGLLRADAAVAERCALIEAEKANYPVVWMCGLLDVPRSSFYAWRTPGGDRDRRTSARARGQGYAGARAISPDVRLSADRRRVEP